MRPSIHNETLRLQVNDALLAQARDKARREGMTVSELVRHALRRELAEAA